MISISVSVSVLVALLVNSTAYADGCAKIKDVSGNTCESLSVKLDLSDCSIKPQVREAKINCAKNHQSATARVWTAEKTFVVKLAPQKVGWGGSSDWAPVGEINENSRQPASEAAATPAAVATPVVAAPVVTTPAAAAAPAAAVASAAPAVAPPIAVATPVVVPATPVEAAPPQPQTTVSGYLDFYYTYNTNMPPQPTPKPTDSGVGLPANSNNLRYYDLYHNQLSLNLAEVQVKHVRQETTFMLDLDFGQAADINAISPYSSTNAPASDEVSKHIGQANVTYTPKKMDRLSITIGKVYTHMGLEGLKNKDNWNYSRSILFGYGLPFWHVGASLGYQVIPSQLTVTTFLYNGWNTIYDNNNGKTFGGQIKWVPSDKFNMIANVVTGPENANNEYAHKSVYELNSTFTLSSQFQVAFDVAHGRAQGTTDTNGTNISASWTGGTIAVKYQPTADFYISPRFEYFNDLHGFILTGSKQLIRGHTLTFAYQINAELQTRLEFRYDKSDQATRFTTNIGTSTEQKTGTLGVLYYF